MSAAFRQHPMTYTLLHVQCDFLRSKGKLDWALQLARQAVNCSPSEFLTWAKLTEVYIDLGQYESALLTLNSCPMFTYGDRDLHRMPTPQRTHLPVKQFIVDSQLLGDDQPEEIEVWLLSCSDTAPGFDLPPCALLGRSGATTITRSKSTWDVCKSLCPSHTSSFTDWLG